MYKSKRKDSEYDVQTEDKEIMRTTRHQFNNDELNPAQRKSNPNFLSESPKRSTNDTNYFYSASKSKSVIRSKSKVAQLPMPFIVRRYSKKASGKRIDNSRNKNDIVNCFSLVDKLIKQNKTPVKINKIRLNRSKIKIQKEKLRIEGLINNRRNHSVSPKRKDNNFHKEQSLIKSRKGSHIFPPIIESKDDLLININIKVRDNSPKKKL